jgi:hypothetical protein
MPGQRAIGSGRRGPRSLKARRISANRFRRHSRPVRGGALSTGMWDRIPSGFIRVADGGRRRAVCAGPQRQIPLVRLPAIMRGRHANSRRALRAPPKAATAKRSSLTSHGSRATLRQANKGSDREPVAIAGSRGRRSGMRPGGRDVRGPAPAPPHDHCAWSIPAPGLRSAPCPASSRPLGRFAPLAMTGAERRRGGMC